ncbi:substrate import-associated zinc metallohydrolase lipoprotein [Flexithrix dorotheae]|uniref:substrate import-associated zinc metallohydrolase lipoprotein n=1 Tax=Flexithrix dorotheae TaxID=70993 RepID=UPI0003789275|nr:substrate import-associated zinc metallohydrolase lipoprotein [Flexithrix dorotheae]
MKTSNIIFLAASLFLVFLSGCYPEDSINVPKTDVEDDLNPTELDQYIEDNFTKEYGVAIRYKFVDRYVSPGQRVTPPRLENVKPMLDFIDKYWVGPYLAVENGNEFFRDHVPAEFILLGGVIYTSRGILLGTADAGARITLLNVNSIDPEDEEWLDQQLGTIYHEFAHIVHQLYKLPTDYEKISPQGYSSSGSWFNVSENEAIARGFVSPYATSSPNEDFAELVAFYVYFTDFEEKYLTPEENCNTAECERMNEGKEKINQKLVAIKEHYLNVTGLDLDELRKELQKLL